MLIGIAGKAGAGKDTAAEWFNGTEVYRIFGLSWPMETMLEPLLKRYMPVWYINWSNREWKETIIPGLGVSPRVLKQKLGTEWRNEVSPDKMLWCKLLELDAGISYGGINKVVVPDIRFPHEQDWVHSHGGLIIKVHRQDLAEVVSHSSENSLDDSKVDFHLMNTGTIEDMYNELQQWWDYIHRNKGDEI